MHVRTSNSGQAALATMAESRRHPRQLHPRQLKRAVCAFNSLNGLHSASNADPSRLTPTLP